MNKPLTNDEIKRIRHALDVAKTQFELDAKATAGSPRTAAEFTRYASECQALLEKTDIQFVLPDHPKPTLYLTVSGGVLSSVSADDVAAANAAIQTVVVIDYDTDGEDDDDFQSVQQTDGTSCMASVYSETIGPLDIATPV